MSDEPEPLTIQLLPPPPINDPVLIGRMNEDGDMAELRLTQQWQDYFNYQWEIITQIVDYINELP